MFLDIFENRISYSIIYTIIYVSYFLHLVNSVITDGFAVFPHPIFYLMIFISGMILAVAMQEMDHRDVNISQILKRLVLGFIPSFIVSIFLIQQIRKEKEQNNDTMYILGLRFILFSTIFVTLLYLIVIGMTLFLVGDLEILYLVVHSTTGLFGFSLGYYLTKITSDENSLLNSFQKNFLFPLLGSKNSRISLSISMLILMLIILIIDKITKLQAITI